jgi:glycosyltransferase involved in cell wall biosynthesis
MRPIAESMTSADVDRVAAAKSWPRICLVTPVYNSGRYIEQTIRSVLAQNYPNLDYFIVDGGSTDNTIEVIRKYEGSISGWISEPDKGMYDAINKGFSSTAGDLMGWISATDQLHAGALSIVGSVFREFPGVEWITGRPTSFSEEGMTIEIGSIPRWSRVGFLAGFNRYIQQECTFWRRSLWTKAGAYVDASRRSASDFELWLRFFRHARLYPVDGLIGGYRYHPDADSIVNIDGYNRICDGIVEKELEGVPWGRALQTLNRTSRAVAHIRVLRGFWYWTVIRGLDWILRRDLTPVIQFRSERWVMTKR